MPKPTPEKKSIARPAPKPVIPSPRVQAATAQRSVGLAGRAAAQATAQSNAAATNRYAGLAFRSANPPPPAPTGLAKVVAPVVGPVVQAAQQINRVGQRINEATRYAQNAFTASVQHSIEQGQGMPAGQREANYQIRTGRGPAAASAGRYGLAAQYAAAQKANTPQAPTPPPSNTWKNNIPEDQRNNPNWRNENAAILMTGQEYINRNNARISISNPNSPNYNPLSPFYQPSMDQWFKSAITAANQGQNMQQFEQQSPRPYAYWEPTAEEIRARNASLVNAGYPNMRWTPYGSGFTEVAEVAPLQPDTGTGPGYDYGGYPEGGGYDYTPELLKWWNQMAMWSFSPQDYNKG